MKIALALLAAASAACLSASAQAQPATPGMSCFLTRDLRNHTVADDRTLYYDVGGRSVLKAVMSNNCFAGSTSSDPIVLRDRVGTGRICNKMDLDVAVRGNRCIVDSVTMLTPAEAAALPRKVKP